MSNTTARKADAHSHNQQDPEDEHSPAYKQSTDQKVETLGSFQSNTPSKEMLLYMAAPEHSLHRIKVTYFMSKIVYMQYKRTIYLQ